MKSLIFLFLLSSCSYVSKGNISTQAEINWINKQLTNNISTANCGRSVEVAHRAYEVSVFKCMEVFAGKSLRGEITKYDTSRMELCLKEHKNERLTQKDINTCDSIMASVYPVGTLVNKINNYDPRCEGIIQDNTDYYFSKKAILYEVDVTCGEEVLRNEHLSYTEFSKKQY